MNDIEFRINLHSKLCSLADLVLLYYNPCKAVRGSCLKADPNPCCVRTRFKKMTASNECFFLGDDGCTFPNIECKVWLCSVSRKNASQECLTILSQIENIAKSYGLTNEC